jgi:8-oxo-dGTP diphosphatase
MALPQTPALTTDCVIFDPVGRVLLIRRKHEPSAGRHALPGGFVKIGETVEAACRREVREEAGVEVSELTLVGVYSDLKRDPRGHIVSVAYATQLPGDALPRAGSDATSVEWVDTRQITLGFDHARILADAKAKVVKRLGDDLDWNFPEAVVKPSVVDMGVAGCDWASRARR